MVLLLSQNGGMKCSSPMALLYPQCSHILMAECQVSAFGNCLDLFIQVPESAMLIERHSGLKAVRILDPEVIATLAGNWKDGSNGTLRVELMLSDNYKFRYSVTELRIADSTIWLDASEDAETATDKELIQ